MTAKEPEIYKGKKIVVNEDDKEPKLSINGKDIMVKRMGMDNNNEYWTNLVPFITYKNSLNELAKALIDIGVTD